MVTTVRPNRPKWRVCSVCAEFSEEAMYLLHGKNICQRCGVQAIQYYRSLSEERLGDPSSKVKLVGLLALTLCVLLGLSACEGGSDSVDSQGVQKCTVTVNGEEKPCH